ncbi:uncharacterized protein LOC106882117 isoform X2 [Octopus bimaculoides]|uniref:uncharacterized protein LOC106882117 isoform X2 n=1 Tax=Octopus bimaculoides TaxID=37653 RepID=UPI0022E1FA4D|nr:uncharacterized protein LOC106882117 isoform X2 [Octopus bimaculoides]
MAKADLPESPEDLLRLHQQLVWLELLPGIESFFTEILAQENLSDAAESRCKYYVERLEILKLPPTIPPRPRQENPQEPNKVRLIASKFGSSVERLRRRRHGKKCGDTNMSIG